MATRDELLTKITELSSTVEAESAQVRTAVDTLGSLVTSLQDKIAALELAAGTAGDFTMELEALGKLETSIAAVYEPTPAA